MEEVKKVFNSWLIQKIAGTGFRSRHFFGVRFYDVGGGGSFLLVNDFNTLVNV